MSEDINVTDGTVLEALNNKVDLDGGNYVGSPLEEYIHDHCGGLEIGDIGFTQMAIDETKGKRRVLNGQLIIQEQYVQFTNIIKNSVALNPSLACTESEWQTEVTMNTFGLCGKFVIDDEGGTIRLPKYPNYFIAGLANIAPVVGNGMALGLTSGAKNYSLSCVDNADTSGANLYKSGYGLNTGAKTDGGSIDTSGTSYAVGVTTDSTKSGIEAQIKQEKIVGTYFIQVATGAEVEDNIINEIELNNPFSLLDYKYSEYELNNISWLRSQGQYNSKAIYPAVYDLLLKIYNGVETKAGVSVKLSTETFTDYDFVLNTAEETFRLPIKVKLASGKAVVGNGMTLGLTNGTSNFGLWTSTATQFYPNSRVYGQPTGTYSNTVADGTTTVGYGVTTDATKSGLELSDSDLYLYFYVGETVQNANLINAGRIEETLATKTDKVQAAAAAMPSDRYIDLTLGASGTEYTAPANGWVVLTKSTSGQGQYCILQRKDFLIRTAFQQSGGSASQAQLFLPVRKGDVFIVTYTASGTTSYFKFVYAEGEQ